MIARTMSDVTVGVSVEPETSNTDDGMRALMVTKVSYLHSFEPPFSRSSSTSSDSNGLSSPERSCSSSSC